MAGLFDSLMGDLGTDDPRKAAYLALASGLLAGKGNFGQVAGQAMMGSQEAFQNAKKMQQQAAYQAAQMEKLHADAERMKTHPWKDPAVPSPIQMYEYVSKLTPEQRVQFERVQRGAKTFEMNGVQYFMDPVKGPVPLTDLPTQAGAEATIAGAKQTAQEEAKAKYDLVPVFNPVTKQVEMKPRIDVLPQQQPQAAPSVSPQGGSLKATDPNVMQRLIADAKANGIGAFDFNLGGNKGSVTVPKGEAPAAQGQYLAPGEAKRIDEKETEAAKAATKKDTTIRTMNNVLDTVDEAKKIVGYSTSGVGGLLGKVPGTNAKALDAKLAMIKANIGFDRLQEMRDSSPTGGALGQVAIQEINFLQATVASLDQLQSPKDLKDALGKIEKHYNNWLSIVGGERTKPKVLRFDANGNALP